MFSVLLITLVCLCVASTTAHSNLIAEFEVPLCNVSGVTKLGDNVYILCGWFESRQAVIPSIRVYESRHPFDLLWLISIDEILDSPMDIVCSEKANCLYVSDAAWIYKIDLHICQLVRWKSGANFRNSLMSISNEGHLIMVSRGESRFQVDVYRKDTLLQKNFELHSDIRKATQVIQTPQGRFVIICQYTQWEYCRDRFRSRRFVMPLDQARREYKIVEGLCVVNNNGVQIKRLTYGVPRKHLHLCVYDKY